MESRPPTGPNHPSNAQLRSRIETLFDGPVQFEDRSRTFGRAHVVWRVSTHSGEAFFAKQHESPLHFGRALMAHERWFPELKHIDSLALPHAVAVDYDLHLIVVKEIEGQIVDNVSPHDQLIAMRLAGRILRAVHDVDDRLNQGDSEAAHRAMAVKYTGILPGEVSAEEEAWIRSIASDTSIFRHARAVPTHGDFSPRNWILQSAECGPVLGVIDWERARHHAWIHDIVRMMHDYWAREPAGRDAFFAGYGRTPSDAEERQILWSSALMAGASVAWARTFGDRHYEQLNRDLLARLMARHPRI